MSKIHHNARGEVTVNELSISGSELSITDTEEEYPLSVSHHQASARGRQAILEQETGVFQYWEET